MHESRRMKNLIESVKGVLDKDRNLMLGLSHLIDVDAIDDSDERVHKKFLSAYADFINHLYDRNFRIASDIDRRWDIQDAILDLDMPLPRSYQELVKMIH